MGRDLSRILQRELANLDKDVDSRKSAMKALKLYVKDLDSKAIPQFLAQVSETKETGSLSGEYTISLYEVLARVHGANIVPQIDSIMATIIKTLASSAGSCPLQQACSKVVPAIARYGIDPTTPEDKKRQIIHSLCIPLSDSLLGSQESLTSGAALCLKALVDSDNWRFSSDEMVNKVCQNVAGALAEKSTQTNSHMGLVMALAKHNAFIVEAYARLLIQCGLQILDAGAVEGNSQKQFSAIQMVNFLMKCLDPRSIFSELELVIEVMEKCQSDQVAFVRGAAFEALQTARRIAAEKGSNFEKGFGSITGSNFGRRGRPRRRNLWCASDQYPASMSPESQALDSFDEYDFLVESPISAMPASLNSEYDCRSVNRNLWSYDNGGVDISLKDCFFSERSGSHGHIDNGGDYIDEFGGFLQRSPRNGVQRSITPSPPRSPRNGVPRRATPSPRRSRSQINVDNLKIFTTPRKLVRSLQDPSDANSDFSERQTRRFRSPSSSKYEWSQNGFSGEVCYEVKDKGNACAIGEEFQGYCESVSSTDDVPADAPTMQKTHDVVLSNKIGSQNIDSKRKKSTVIGIKLVSSLFFILLVICFSVLWIDVQDKGCHLVPT